jgi:hypothetical protein
MSIYNKEKNIILNNQNPRNFAAQRYYYNIEENELRKIMNNATDFYSEFIEEDIYINEQFVEEYLGRVESDVKILFDSIEKDESVLQVEKNKSIISIFLHDLGYRTKTYRESTESINKETLEVLNQMFPDNKEIYETYSERSAKQKQINKLLTPVETAKTALLLVNN